MASESGKRDRGLIEAIELTPRLFSFFQVVRLLEQASPGSAPIGHRGPAGREAVRLRPSSSLAFQASDVTHVVPRDAPGPDYVVASTLLGLYGSSSPLPAHYSEEILAYETSNSPDLDPVRLFLDVLNHRLLSFLYRAWSKYRWSFEFRPGAKDEISREVLKLIGVGTDSLERAIRLTPTRLLRYAGFITQRPKSAGALAGVLSDYFEGTRVRVEQCVERRVPLPRRDRNRLGVANTTLADDFVLGGTVLDHAGKFRVCLGPFEEVEAFEAFLPESERSRDLDALIRLMVPDPLEYDVELAVDGAAVPMTRLASDESAGRLGWTSWLKSGRGGEDVAEIFPATRARAA